MPNHIKSKIEIQGSKEELAAVLSEFSTNHERTPDLALDGDVICTTKRDGDNDFDYSVGWLNEETGIFRRRDEEDVKGIPDGFTKKFAKAFIQFPDFDKVMPSPKGMNISSDNWLMPMDNEFSSNTKFKEHLDKMRDFFKNQPTRKDEVLKNFLQGVENYLNHGHASWYSWNVANWGTKWNSYSCKRVSDTVFEFETAWSNVRDIVELISVKFPTVTFIYEWADEDTGSNCGKVVYLGGEKSSWVPENGSKEAYEMAFNLRPDDKENYSLVDGEYKYIDED